MTPRESPTVLASQIAKRISEFQLEHWRTEADGNRVTLHRLVPWQADNNNLSGFGSADAAFPEHVCRSFTFELEIGGRLSTVAFKQLETRQRQLVRRLQRLEAELEPLEGDGMDHAYNPDHYEPKTSSERAKVEERKQLKWQLRKVAVPIGYVDDKRAIFRTHTAPLRMGEGRLVCNDCSAVDAKLRTLVTPYPGAAR